MTPTQLEKLFVEQIGDLYDAEKQLVKALPKMKASAKTEELSEAIAQHLEETEDQVRRLEEVFRDLEMTPKGHPCQAMKGLIQEGSESMMGQKPGVLRDLAIIAAAQRVEHYEISAYGTAKAMATALGRTETADLLRETEEEEAAADSKLSEIAMTLYDLESEDDESEKRVPPQPVGGLARKMSSAKGR